MFSTKNVTKANVDAVGTMYLAFYLHIAHCKIPYRTVFHQGIITPFYVKSSMAQLLNTSKAVFILDLMLIFNQLLDFGNLLIAKCSIRVAKISNVKRVVLEQVQLIVC